MSMGIVYSSLTLVPPNNHIAFAIFTGIDLRNERPMATITA